jgi:type IVB pilus formation R64 PilN family outer membrane protein
MMRSNPWMALCAAAVLLSSCANTESIDTRDDLRKASESVDRTVASIMPPAQARLEEHTSSFLFDTTRVRKASALDAKLDAPIKVRVKGISDPVRALWFLAQAEGRSIMDVKNVCSYSDGSGGSASKGSPATKADNAGGPAGTTTAVPASQSFNINFEGTGRQYVDYVARLFDYAVEIDDDAIHVSDCVTQSFTLAGSISPVKSSFGKSSGTSGSTGKGGSSGGSVSVELSADTKPLETLQKGLESLLSPKGRIQFAPALASVVVTDRPSVVSQIRKYIAHYNELSTKQVALDISIVQYEDTADQGQSVDVHLSFKAGDGGADFRGPRAEQPLAGGISGSIIEGPFAGSQAAVSSLFARDTASVETSAKLIALNGFPVPFNVGRTINYVREVQTERDAKFDTESRTLVTDTLNTGLELGFLANVADGGTISLTVLVHQNELIAFDKIQDLQLPRTRENRFLQSMAVKSGDLIFLTGFEELRNGDTASSTVPGTLALGGSTDKTKTKRKIAIVIVPRLVS